ncbi:NHR-62 protein [Aphelenchoides avenae]|nr:NHR-62 protein [Aphelenchus avenae]
MNPRAVQNERSDADKAEGEGSSQQHVISVSTYLNTSAGGGEEDDYDDDPSERERRSVDIQTDNYELSGAVEIDANSISPALLKKELPSIGDETERFLRELLDLEQQVMERVDDVDPPANPTLTNRNFATVFYNPNLLCSRSKISPTGERIAVLADTTHDWRRCFVLYADFLQALPDFQRLSPDDRIKLAEARYPSYHWFVVANWTVKTGCNGVCYCNETYFPRDPSLQCMFDQMRCTERMFHLLVEPLRELNLNEEERVIMCVVAIFSVPVPDMSDEGAAILGNIRQRYLDVLHRYMVNTYAGMDADLYAAVRMGNLLVLLSSITELVHLTGDNIRLNDVLHIMDFDKFGSAVRDIYDKAL